MQKLKNIITVVKDKSSPIYIENIIVSLISGYLLSSIINITLIFNSYENIQFVTEVNILFLIAFTVITAIGLNVAALLLKTNRVTIGALLSTATAYAGLLVYENTMDIWFGCGIAFFALLIAVWCAKQPQGIINNDFDNEKITFICVVAMFALFTISMSFATIMRHRSFTTSCFDFGIFAQMFEYMKSTGLPLTTVERNELLSHFAVHFSPVFYLLLPGYFIFSSPEYLLIMQAIIVGAGVFGVYGIARELGFSQKNIILCCLIYTFYPSMCFGTFYDFHENKFLTVFILFAFYYLLKRNFAGFAVFAVLICTVKEDAAIYLVAIALYMILSQKMFKAGSITLAFAVVYFIFAINMVQSFNYGSNDMQFGARYGNFEIDGQVGVGTIIRVVFTNLGYALKEMFTTDKVEFLLWMFLQLMFAPFMTKKVSTLVLLSPMIIINLMPNWVYQYDVGYQYTFGVAALIFICAILSLQNMSEMRRRTVLTAGLIVCISLTVPRYISRTVGYTTNYNTNRKTFYNAKQLIFETVPKDAQICVEGSFVPQLYEYKEVYITENGELRKGMEYYIVKNDYEYTAELTASGYELIAKDNFVQIYKLK